MWQTYSCPRCGMTVNYGQYACTHCGLVFYPGGMGVHPYGQHHPNQPQTWNQPSSYYQHPAGGNLNQYPQQHLYGPGTTAPEKKSSSGLVVSLIVFIVILCVASATVFIMNTKSSTKLPTAEPSQSASSTSTPSKTEASETQVVTPDATTTHMPTATNDAGSVTSSATVTVNPAIAPVVTSFTATPATISSGQSSTLQWNITGATSVSINGIGSVNSTSGTRVVTPAATTTYTLIATNSAGSVNSSATVKISPSTSNTASPSLGPWGQTGGQSGSQSSGDIGQWQTWGKSGGQSASQSSGGITPENWGK